MKNRVVWVVTILFLGGLSLSPSLGQEVENLLENGGFETGDTTAWGVYGAGTMEVVTDLVDASVPEGPIEGNYALHLVVDASGVTNNWDIGLQNAGHVFEQGKYYTLSTWLKSASGDLTIRIKPERGADPWEGYGAAEVTITEEWAEYSVTTPVFTADVTPATITYHIAFADGDFFVDGVRFYEGDYVEPDFLNDISASNPIPESGEKDVARDYTVLSWKPDPLAGTHNVYFGETFEDVNAADTGHTANVISRLGQDANSLALDRLDMSKTYYWRVDEVNATPDKTVFKGKIWSFEVEPEYYTIPGANITATASSTGIPYASADKTIDGSGLNALGQHGTNVDGMWLSENSDPNISIQYAFDRIYKLYGLKIWNNNQTMETFLGVGAKDVTIESSTDGIEWSVLGDVEVARATGDATYDGAPMIPMNGTAVQYVRLNIHNNWGGILVQSGLSEVQFTYAPMLARHEKPASGSTKVSPDAQLSWRPGREAGQHQIYLGTDLNALALVDAVTEPRYALESSDPQLGQTYFWRVDEVNETETPSLWAGPVWRLSTPSAIIVDDFESYTNYSPNRPFQTWLDGFGYSADEFFPVKYAGNGTGAGVGHDIWGPASPYFDDAIMETLISISGRQSMPFYYNNTGGNSHIDRIWSTPQDWTKNGIQTLTVNFYGDPNNTAGPLYVKINGTKVTYPDTSDLKLPLWHLWTIDLASLGINLQAITNLSIGVEGTGAGMILIDDIALYRKAPSLLTAWYSLENNANDISGNGHDGVAMGDPVYLQGADGMGLQFDGAGQYVDLGTYNPSEGTGQLSVSLWAKWQGLNGGYQGLIGKRDTWAANDMMWQIEANIDTGALTSSRTGSYPGSGNPVLPIGEWTHVGLSFNGTTSRFYVNGVETGSGAFSFGSDTEAAIQFGACERNGGNPFNGALDEIKLFNRPLSEGEMRVEAGLPLN